MKIKSGKNLLTVLLGKSEINFKKMAFVFHENGVEPYFSSEKSFEVMVDDETKNFIENFKKKKYD